MLDSLYSSLVDLVQNPLVGAITFAYTALSVACPLLWQPVRRGTFAFIDFLFEVRKRMRDGHAREVQNPS